MTDTVKSQSSEAGVGLSLCRLLQKLTGLIRMCDGIHDREVTSKGAKEQSIKGKGSATCELLCQGMNEQNTSTTT